ncbi:hypothetical protein EYF80_054860 [Liparis tanakae]|uniref:Uncharacterized protein n=1 Tax=Liparis tanakae TaxID=230148 RepID=A0A4Z2F1G7_9TELE|nr:hypothetical protein EYF80_054860 [Liparis tanakae]
MSVRCFASSEPRIPSSNLGQEDKLFLLNGQHQHHRGEDGHDVGQHHDKEGEVQDRHGEHLHQQGQEHHVVGVLHHHQWEDQDRPGGRLLQQRLHHHLFSESSLPQKLSQTQDALDERGPGRGVGGGPARHVRRKKKKEAPSQRTFGHHYIICTESVPTESQHWIRFTDGPLTAFWSCRIYRGNSLGISGRIR